MSTRPSVLVIDDEPGIREMLRYELSQEGFDVEMAEDGLAAVEAVKRRKFDLAVTDLRMPGMDGVATMEALRSLDSDIEVIVATGYASVETAVACMKRGAYDYIQKPYDLSDLKLLLESAARKSRPQEVVALCETCLLAGFTRLATREQDRAPERVDVAEVLKECLALMPLAAENRVCLLPFHQPMVTFLSGEDLRTAVLNVLGYLWAAGAEISIDGNQSEGSVFRILLPNPPAA
jgi:DNA-binding response OmpR family regulator